MIIHTVSPGESVWSISRIYGVNPNRIVEVNQLPDPSRLLIGQSLLVPRDRPATHMVQPGENLWVLAQRFGTTVQAIAEANQIVDPALIFPGMVLTIPPRPRPTIEANAYVQRLDAVGLNAVEETGQYLTYLSLFSYEVREDGTLAPLADEAIIAAARARGAAPLMVITNIVAGEDFSPDLARAILGNVEVQEALITNILATMEARGFTGVNVDFEYVYPADRELYNDFLRRVVARLRPAGYTISSAVAPKVRADQVGLLYEAHDYPVHGELLDFVIIMTYEWGWIGGPPMAVSPVNQMRRVLDYAVTAIPRAKIMMGMPLYGYDWTLPFVAGETRATTLSPQGALARAIQYNAAIEYDPIAEAPFYGYYDEQGREHIVWFEDARSVQAKFDLVREYNLRGVSYWVLGLPFPQNWPLLADNFEIRKIIG
ncbi:LysM peptidoglycan-binding domain-containing protein [Heliorestis acidaminivorans]|uniref:LysM peptidoglycan-binding domain-containing protein n=1 Tax=Heliorestis acidaminivorans TaxID=553427 RepID=A0A6I0F0X9_9FIRM|nr:LysM peptidoglycan-binding domain-containing protein [Heliorestis acidaminivorans]KAB2952974.1 LysM peptidoglycan-binding domain-containing protein [Heliorestis acidaminivorans]